MSYRPITDTWSCDDATVGDPWPNIWPLMDEWILARSKVKYYGAYPAGFLHRGRQLVGATLDDPVLHVCGGKIRDYPYRGLGPNDITLDLDPACNPDLLQDAREPYPEGYFRGVMIDRPYTDDDADHYAPGRIALPAPELLIKHAIAAVPIGGKVGMLDYYWPAPPKNAVECAIVMVTTGRRNRVRQFTVFKRLS